MLSGLLARWRRRRAPVELLLYTKADCPLCDALKAALTRVRVQPPFRVLEIDIERDAELRDRYALSVPVLELAGRALCKGRLDPAEFERRYARRVAELEATPASEGGVRG